RSIADPTSARSQTPPTYFNVSTKCDKARFSLDGLVEDRVEARPRPGAASSGTRLKILFAVAAWGLGHATRDLPLISRLLDCGHDVTVVSSERALALLKQELGQRCGFLEWPDLPLTLSRSVPMFYAKFTFSLPLAFRTIVAERRALESLLDRRPFDRIISDSRFGIRSPRVSSFHLCHGLRFIAPRRTAGLEYGMEYVYHRCFGQTSKFAVPDTETNSLSGDLSHGLRFIHRDRLTYLGILSGIRRRPVETDIDCYVSISGREPQRQILEDIVLRQVYDVPGRVVVSLGKPEEAGQVRFVGRAEVRSFVNREQQQDLMNRANLIVSRSGYTTIMELAELGKRALLIPTPGQTEQEYLADYHSLRGSYYSIVQKRLDLPRDLKTAAGYPGYQSIDRTESTIDRFIELVTN
ncbi:MAG TPA: glycosyltransferase, partial [Chloroflexota bacterium]|nr:glycosyltransferase [Chloroflexota bacterium]